MLHIAGQYGRQIGVGDGGVAAADEFYQRADTVTDRDLFKAEFSGERLHGLFMSRVTPGVHEDDGAGGEPGIACAGQFLSGGCEVERCENFAISGDTFVDLDDVFMERCWQFDLADKEFGAMLIADAQLIGEACGSDQKGAGAFAFEQGVGCDRCSHMDGGDLVLRNRLTGLQGKDAPDSLNRGVGVVSGVVRKKFFAARLPLWVYRHKIGKSTAAVDPDMPEVLQRHKFAQVASETSVQQDGT